MKLYNTLTKTKDELDTANEIKMYACGPTVYNYIHIGNARPLVIFDTLRNYLVWRGAKVRFVQNFTDIDDKMIKRAEEEGITVKSLGERFINEYYIDAQGLGVTEADEHPKATENIEEIIALIENLIAKNHAYEKKGNVYFKVNSFADYGKLSHQPLEELEAGARIEIGENKENPMDFALWKAYKEGEPFWESPWGKGRPGWHIECSAMANKFLGDTIDIHCGGQDLIFPHHENEIAQSEAANGFPLAKIWIHNGYINIDNKKMSKSAGNFFTVRQVSDTYGYEVLRFFLISAHYRSPINYSAEVLEQSRSALDRLYNCIQNLDFYKSNGAEQSAHTEEEFTEKLPMYKDRFCECLDNDFNTADALAVIFELVRDINILTADGISKSSAAQCKKALSELCLVLGFSINTQKAKDSGFKAEIEKLIEQRQAARAAKDFKTADEIRSRLKETGVILEDTPQGVKWKIEK